MTIICGDKAFKAHGLVVCSQSVYSLNACYGDFKVPLFSSFLISVNRIYDPMLTAVWDILGGSRATQIPQ